MRGFINQGSTFGFRAVWVLFSAMSSFVHLLYMPGVPKISLCECEASKMPVPSREYKAHDRV